jgi:hypothetical protein
MGHGLPSKHVKRGYDTDEQSNHFVVVRGAIAITSHLQKLRKNMKRLTKYRRRQWIHALIKVLQNICLK